MRDRVRPKFVSIPYAMGLFCFLVEVVTPVMAQEIRPSDSVVREPPRERESRLQADRERAESIRRELTARDQEREDLKRRLDEAQQRLEESKRVFQEEKNELQRSFEERMQRFREEVEQRVRERQQRIEDMERRLSEARERAFAERPQPEWRPVPRPKRQVERPQPPNREEPPLGPRPQPGDRPAVETPARQGPPVGPPFFPRWAPRRPLGGVMGPTSDEGRLQRIEAALEHIRNELQSIRDRVATEPSPSSPEASDNPRGKDRR